MRADSLSHRCAISSSSLPDADSISSRTAWASSNTHSNCWYTSARYTSGMACEASSAALGTYRCHTWHATPTTHHQHRTKKYTAFWQAVSGHTQQMNYCAVQWSWFARVNALCNLLHDKLWEVAVSLLGRFLSRHCFTLCITMEVEPRIAKQYKCHHCHSCKNYQGKGIEGGKKVSLHRFLADQKITSLWERKNAFWGIL